MTRHLVVPGVGLALGALPGTAFVGDSAGDDEGAAGCLGRVLSEDEGREPRE